MRLLTPALMLLVLGACTTQPPAPVSDRTIGIGPYGSSPAPATTMATSGPGFYTVKKGDTLYSISLDHGQSYRDIAVWNNLDQYFTIKPGQILRVTPEDQAGTAVVKPIQSGDTVEIRPVTSATAPAVTSAPAASATAPYLKTEPRGGKVAYSDAAWAAEQQRPTPAVAAAPPAPAPTPAPAAAPASTPAPTTPVPAPAVAPAAQDSEWVWPTSGTVGTTFAESNKGIDIPAKPGQPVVAANSGTVTLVSNALRGYGNLLVIKHGQTLLSVYAHNSKILVSEGQSVAKGQKVAEAGNTDSDTTKLHFEIRSMGKPVDPLKYLPPR